MTSNLSEIFSRFYLKVTDYHLAGLEEDVAAELLRGYLRSTLSRPMVRRLFDSVAILPAEVIINEDDEEEQLEERVEYEILNPLDDSDKDFIENVLVTGMIVEWLDPQVYSVLNTAQFFGNSEQKYYSQANHLTELRELLNKAQVDLRKLIRDRAQSLAILGGLE